MKLKLEFNKIKIPLEISSNLRGDRIVTNLILGYFIWFRELN